MKRPTTKAAASAKLLSLGQLAHVTGGVACKNPDTGEVILFRGYGCPEGWEKVQQ